MVLVSPAIWLRLYARAMPMSAQLHASASEGVGVPTVALLPSENIYMGAMENKFSGLGLEPGRTHSMGLSHGCPPVATYHQ